MPYSPEAKPEDYPERRQARSSAWISEHQLRNLEHALGHELCAYLGTILAEGGGVRRTEDGG